MVLTGGCFLKKSYLYAIITVLIWATTPAVSKVLLTDIPDFQVLLICSAIAFVFLAVLNAATGQMAVLRRYSSVDCLKMSALGFLGLFMYTSLFYYGLTQMTSQEASILNYLWPVMLVLFSCLILKEKMTLRKAAAMLCSFAGIIILISGKGADGGGNMLHGAAACITAAACYGLFSVLNKKVNYNQNIAMMIIWLTTAVCAFISLSLTGSWVHVSGAQWLGLLWSGIAINALAYLLWALALSYADDTAYVANIAYLTPFLSVVISAVFLKERMHVSAVTALFLIVGGIMLQNIPFKKRQA